MDEINFDLGDLERIKRGTSKYSFPTVTLLEDRFYFNIQAQPHMKDIDFLTISTAVDYIVLMPAHMDSAVSFRLLRRGGWAFMTYPVGLHGAKIKRGVYKLYKYKNGFAFKRYEPLEVME